MAALSRFVSHLGERAMPFYKLLKKQDKFQWTSEAQQAFDKLKEFLTNPPVLVPPMPEEPLLLYITATSHVVSTAIVVERQEEGHIQKVQHPVYFISEVLNESKIRYPQVQKILYVVKLVYYFQAHPISVVTSFPIGEILHNRDATGRIASGRLSSAPSSLPSNHERPSSPKHSSITSPSGQKSRYRPSQRSSSIGQCTSMAL